MNQNINSADYIRNLDNQDATVILDYIVIHPWIITRFLERFSQDELKAAARKAIEQQPRSCAFLFKLGLLTKEEAQGAARLDMEKHPVFRDIYRMEGILT